MRVLSPVEREADMSKPLYWSTLQLYEACPQQCLWKRGYPGIDCGGGMGKRKPVPQQKSEHHLVMGIVIGDALERLYNDELWRDPKNLRTRLIEIVKLKFETELAKPKRYIDWNQTSHEEMYDTCMNGVLDYVKTMKHNKLLGEYARSEVDLRTHLDKYNPIGGRADLIIRRSDSGTAIYDFKNSKYAGKYTDPDQLRFYALCFYLAYHKMPNKLGFIYTRFPHGTCPEGYDPDTYTGVVDVPFTEEDIKGLAQRAKEVGKGMWKKKFPATPTPKVCRLCDYESVCPERQAQRAANSRGRRKNKPEIIPQGVEGVVELGFGKSLSVLPAVGEGKEVDDADNQ